METLAKKLANRIASSLGCDEEKKAVVAYGLFAVIQIAITLLLVLLLGILAGAPVEAMIVCFSASILRKYSGGAHAANAELCTFISAVYCTLTAYLSKKLLYPIYRPFPMVLAIVIIYCLSFWVVYKLAPVDSPNKPIKTEKKKKRLRKGSFIILTAYASLSCFLLILGYDSGVFASYGISLLLGVSWQVFTLTRYGSLLLGKLNYFFDRKEVLK